MPGTLVVIDMQEGFFAATNAFTVRAVTREIKKAIKNKWAVILVQYHDSGLNVPPIDFLLKDYHLLDNVVKYGNDGGEEVYESLMCNGFNYKNIRVCGVNTDACVCETVFTLAETLPYSKIEVVEEACNSCDYNDFSWINELPNVNLLEAKI